MNLIIQIECNILAKLVKIQINLAVDRNSAYGKLDFKKQQKAKTEKYFRIFKTQYLIVVNPSNNLTASVKNCLLILR